MRALRIEVVRSGGFTGVPRRAALDTTGRPDAARLEALADAALAAPAPASARPAPDAFDYEVTVDGRAARWAEPGLTAEQRELLSEVLGEGA